MQKSRRLLALIATATATVSLGVVALVSAPNASADAASIWTAVAEPEFVPAGTGSVSYTRYKPGTDIHGPKVCLTIEQALAGDFSLFRVHQDDELVIDSFGDSACEGASTSQGRFYRVGGEGNESEPRWFYGITTNYQAWGGLTR